MIKRGYNCKSCRKNFNKDKQRYKKHINHCSDRNRNIQIVRLTDELSKGNHYLSQIQSQLTFICKNKRFILRMFDRKSQKDINICLCDSFSCQGLQQRDLATAAIKKQQKVQSKGDFQIYSSSLIKKQSGLYYLSWCDVCSIEFKGYKQHIESTFHKNKLKLSYGYALISELVEQFKNTNFTPLLITNRLLKQQVKTKIRPSKNVFIITKDSSGYYFKDCNQKNRTISKYHPPIDKKQTKISQQCLQTKKYQNLCNYKTREIVPQLQLQSLVTTKQNIKLYIKQEDQKVDILRIKMENQLLDNSQVIGSNNLQQINARCPFCKQLLILEEGSMNCYNLNCNYGEIENKEYEQPYRNKRNTSQLIDSQIIKSQQQSHMMDHKMQMEFSMKQQ